jgi:hypothetical protein
MIISRGLIQLGALGDILKLPMYLIFEEIYSVQCTIS